MSRIFQPLLRPLLPWLRDEPVLATTIACGLFPVSVLLLEMFGLRENDPFLRSMLAAAAIVIGAIGMTLRRLLAGHRSSQHRTPPSRNEEDHEGGET